MNIITHIGSCFEKLVKEFIANISSKWNIKGSQEYKKVHVIGKCVRFSPSFIDKHLKRSMTTGSKEVSLDKIVKEIIIGHAQKWHKLGLLPSKKVIVKYVMLNRIGEVN